MVRKFSFNLSDLNFLTLNKRAAEFSAALLFYLPKAIKKKNIIEIRALKL